MYKTKLVHRCDVLLVVEIEIFNFCLFVCLLVYFASRFANFAKGKWSNHDTKIVLNLGL